MGHPTDSLAALLDAGRSRPGPWAEDARGPGIVRRDDLAELAAAWRTATTGADGDGAPVRAGLLAADPVAFATLLVCLVAAGVEVVPLDPAAPAAAQRELLGRARATALVTTDAEAARPAAAGTRRVIVAGPAGQPPDGRPLLRARPAAGGVLLFSSGSTGPRKAVLLAEQRLLHVARAVAEHHRLGPADRCYNPLPLFHVNAEVVAVLGTLVSGGGLVLDARFHRTGFADLVRERGITWVNAVPAIITILAAEPGDVPLPRTVRFVRSASAPLPVPVLERFEARWGVPVVETYGMTEAASQITANPLDDRRPGSVGVPVGVELRVDARGHVWIRGAGVVTEYEDGAGADRFDAQGWLDTGDVGRLDDDGHLYLLGRGGDAINRGGEKIFPREIEEVLRRHPGVRDAVVVPRPDPVLGEVPVAFVLPAHPCADEGPDADQLAADLSRLCETELARPHRPVQLRLVPELPLGATGKVSRPALRELAAADAL